MKHKHCDLIIAWANGAKIQIQYPSGNWVEVPMPTWDTVATYRIKPEPKPDAVVYGWIKKDNEGLTTHKLTQACFARDNRDNIKLTFDGETGKLKSAEVI